MIDINRPNAPAMNIPQPPANDWQVPPPGNPPGPHIDNGVPPPPYNQQQPPQNNQQWGFSQEQIAGGVGVAVGLAQSIGEELKMASRHPELKTSAMIGKGVAKGVGQVVGGALGGWAGSVTGTATGASLVAPCLAASALAGPAAPLVAAGCTALPSIGGAIGGYAGSKGGFTATKALADGIDSAVNRDIEIEQDDGPAVTPGNEEKYEDPEYERKNDEKEEEKHDDRNPAFPRNDTEGNLPPKRIPVPGQETQVGQGEQGDYFLNNLTTTIPVANMRVHMSLGSAKDVIPPTREQLISDIQFDMFDAVPSGFGNGSDNKLFLMQEARDNKIRYAGPMNYPGTYIGPTNGASVAPWQLQRTFPLELAEKLEAENALKAKAASDMLISNPKDKSSNLLGDDLGYPYPFSSKSLKRSRDSPFEPVIRNDYSWERVKPATGYNLNQKRMRLSTDAQRNPENLVSYTSGMGGPTLDRRNALEVILP